MLGLGGMMTGTFKRIGTQVVIVKISEEDAVNMMSGLGHPGVCIGCGYLDEFAGCEPDACEYECPGCGENKLYGLEEALMMGNLEIE